MSTIGDPKSMRPWRFRVSTRRLCVVVFDFFREHIWSVLVFVTVTDND